MNKYIGNENQLYGVEEVRLCGGKGDGMRFYNVRNGKGLEFSVSLDRCADISKISLKGDNYGYFAPCGYVAPHYFDNKGAGFLKSFTAGFITTCGLTAVGSPCTDNGEELPLHGTISHVPAENSAYWIDENTIHIKAVMRDAALFGNCLVLEREYICPLDENALYITDKIKNIGSAETPFEILYHCNLGYPLLSESMKLTVPSSEVVARNDHAQTGIDRWNIIEKPQRGYEEMCFFHKMSGDVTVSAVNPEIGKGLEMSYNTDKLGYFTEWKMMGEYEYVLGIEPGNCLPDGRAAMREAGTLQFLQPGEEKVLHLNFKFTEV